MDDHEVVILQKRIGARPVDGRTGHRRERLRRARQKEAEESATSQPHADRVGHVLGVPVAILPGGDRDVRAHDQAPEEDRPFEGRPEADQRNPGRHRARAHVSHVAHAEVVGEKRVLHDQVGQDHERRECVSEAPRPSPTGAARARARGEAHQGARAGGQEGEKDQDTTERGDHAASVSDLWLTARASGPPRREARAGRRGPPWSASAS